MAFAVNLLRDQEGHGMAGSKKAGQRIYRTVDGELVGEGDPGAAFLAYVVGDPITTTEVDAYDQLVSGDEIESGMSELHDRLATALAGVDELLTSNSLSAEQMEALAALFDEAARVVREYGAAEDDETGEPVHEPVRDAHDAPVAQAEDEAAAAAKKAPARATKAAAKPGDKAAAKPADK
jgi:hypothetical protein